MQKGKRKQHLTTTKITVKCKLAIYFTGKILSRFLVPTEPPDNSAQLFCFLSIRACVLGVLKISHDVTVLFSSM